VEAAVVRTWAAVAAVAVSLKVRLLYQPLHTQSLLVLVD
jgi:hypothetical protein